MKKYNFDPNPFHERIWSMRDTLVYQAPGISILVTVDQENTCQKECHRKFSVLYPTFLLLWN